jgi:hypothetical protein
MAHVQGPNDARCERSQSGARATPSERTWVPEELAHRSDPVGTDPKYLVPTLSVDHRSARHRLDYRYVSCGCRRPDNAVLK